MSRSVMSNAMPHGRLIILEQYNGENPRIPSQYAVRPAAQPSCKSVCRPTMLLRHESCHVWIELVVDASCASVLFPGSASSVVSRQSSVRSQSVVIFTFLVSSFVVLFRSYALD